MGDNGAAKNEGDKSDESDSSASSQAIDVMHWRSEIAVDYRAEVCLC